MRVQHRDVKAEGFALSTGKIWLPGQGFMGPVSISSQSWFGSLQP